MKERFRLFFKRHQAAVLIVIFVLLLILIIFGTQIVLFVNFLLGNDIIVKLNVDQESIKLVHGKEGIVKFEMSVTTNPFCSAECSSEFKDLGYEKVVGQEQFVLNAGITKEQEYIISPLENNVGYTLYQFRLQCHSAQSWLCQTKERPTSRVILVTAFTNLTEEESQLKNQLQGELVRRFNETRYWNLTMALARQTLAGLNHSLNVNFMFDEVLKMEEDIEEEKIVLSHVEELWKEQKYWIAQQFLSQKNDTITHLKVSKLKEDVLSLIAKRDALRLKLEELQPLFNVIISLSFYNETSLSDINETIEEYNHARAFLEERGEFSAKEVLVDAIFNKTKMLYDDLAVKEQNRPLQLVIKTDIAKDVLCFVSGECLSHPSIIQRINSFNDSFNQTCLDIELLHKNYTIINQTMMPIFVNQSYPTTLLFWQNISASLYNIKESVIEGYLNEIKLNGANSTKVNHILIQESTPNIITDDFLLSYNSTPAQIFSLNEIIPLPCSQGRPLFKPLENLTFSSYSWPLSQSSFEAIEIEEPQNRCCLKGGCNYCCDKDCQSQNKIYPIVFLHGHAFNKGVSTEYSLDAFNGIQEKLEHDGYVNGGAISLYSKRDTPEGEWGLFGLPFTVKASYYYDFFKTPQNYVVIQQKSESIDTYAVRLKELVDTVLYKTGNDKIVIVAHSMGGLVARRYMQLFGEEKVAKLITIGTPHQGITQDIFDNCNLVGEERECRDMKDDSAFMSKLKLEGGIGIPAYVIIGQGCSMTKGDGDGVVLSENADLEGARRYFVDGTCSALHPLHTSMLDINAYPEVYKYIEKALED